MSDNKEKLPEIMPQDVASMGWRTANDQNLLYDETLLVLGAGGAGGCVAVSAAMDGMKVIVADPEEFDESNMNRQTGASVKTIGMNKAKVVGGLAIDSRGPGSVEICEDGLTLENIDQLFERATIVLDAIDIGRPDLSVALGRKAKEKGVPLFTGVEVGSGCAITCFDPDNDEWTADRYFGVEGMQVDECTEISVDQQLVHMPSYTPPGMLEAFMAGELPSTPGIRSGVLILAGAMEKMMTRWSLNKTDNFPQFVYPNLYVFDPIDGRMVVHAKDREDHLTKSMGNIGSNMVSSGFSRREEYTVLPSWIQKQ